jgi:hypothetical protein
MTAMPGDVLQPCASGGLARALLLAVACSLAGCRSPAVAPPGLPPAVLVALRGTPVLDGKLDQPVWHAAASTTAFIDPRHDRPVPHTEARAAWDDTALYLAVYVADEALRSGDRVHVDFAPGQGVDLAPDRTVHCRFGAVTDCAALGVTVAFDVDGDVDATVEQDEEWSVTLAIPWHTLAPGNRPLELPLSLRRDDQVEGRAIRTVWSRGRGVLRLR